MSIENAIGELKTLMGERLCISAAERKQYGQNETYYKEMLPDAVVYPKDENEVSEVMQICNKERQSRNYEQGRLDKVSVFKS